RAFHADFAPERLEAVRIVARECARQLLEARTAKVRRCFLGGLRAFGRSSLLRACGGSAGPGRPKATQRTERMTEQERSDRSGAARDHQSASRECGTTR